MQVTWTGADEDGWRVLDVTGADRTRLRAARRWAKTVLATLTEPQLVDTLMVVGELLENAYVHAGGPRQLRIHHVPEPCEVTVAVADTGAGEPRLRTPGRGGGLGLQLVDRLCVTWGVSRHDEGKLVWGRLDCEASDAA